MFKQRLLTTLILMPIVLFTILFAPSLAIQLALFALVCFGAWEWTFVIPVAHPIERYFFVVLLCIFIWMAAQWFYVWSILGFILWMLILLAVLTFPKSQKIWGYQGVVALGGFIILPLFFNSFIAIADYESGRALLLYFLFIVWAADIGAYLVGKQWGRKKLIPRVSPGKTVEGSLGGFLLAMFVGWGWGLYFKPDAWLAWFVLTALIALLSILGDLFISILKRRCHLKDSGFLFPGHGGVLDRVDGLIVTAPFFVWGYTFLIAKV